MLLREGRVVGAGPIADVLNEGALESAFGVPVRLGRFGNRWTAHVESGPSSSARPHEHVTS